MAKHDILISDGDTSNGNLTLIPGDNIEVKRGEKVTWSIPDTVTKVASFRIKKKGNSEEIFADRHRPPSNHTRNGEGNIHSLARKGAEYYYSIFWKDDKGDEHEYDPKIAVNPHKRFDLITLILIAMAAVLGIFTLNFLRKEKNRR